MEHSNSTRVTHTARFCWANTQHVRLFPLLCFYFLFFFTNIHFSSVHFEYLEFLATQSVFLGTA